MYYVRKMSKPTNLYKIKEAKDIATVHADFLGQELRTSQNTLSVWRCENMDDVGYQNAIKAALFASSDIIATQLIVLDSEMLEAAGIKTEDVQGKTSYVGLNNLHTDLCELTYEKIGILLDLYRKTINLQDRIPKVEKKDFQDFVVDAHRNNLLDESGMDEKFKKAVGKLLDKRGYPNHYSESKDK